MGVGRASGRQGAAGGGVHDDDGGWKGEEGG